MPGAGVGVGVGVGVAAGVESDARTDVCTEGDVGVWVCAPLTGCVAGPAVKGDNNVSRIGISRLKPKESGNPSKSLPSSPRFTCGLLRIIKLLVPCI